MSTSTRSRRGSRSSTKSPRTCKRPTTKPKGTMASPTEEVRERLSLSDLVSDEVTSARRSSIDADRTARDAAEIATANPTPENIAIANETALAADMADAVLEDVERRSVVEPLGVTPVGECPRHSPEKLMSMTKKELDVLAKSLDIKSPYRYRKADLIENIVAVEAGRMPTAAPVKRSASPKRKTTPKKAAAKKKSPAKKKTTTKRKSPAKKKTTAKRKSPAKKTTAKRKSPAKKKTTGDLKDLTSDQLDRKLKRKGIKVSSGVKKSEKVAALEVQEMKKSEKDDRTAIAKRRDMSSKKKSSGRKTPTKKASGRKTPMKTASKRKSPKKTASKRKSPTKKATRKSAKK
ncbi:MAG: hypothetical protein O2U61_05010 [Candidatus Bathyarchaeota archaeon]|nr:hypothetical protein [Candidatus Bathyarchaeota archaeon]